VLPGRLRSGSRRGCSAGHAPPEPAARLRTCAAVEKSLLVVADGVVEGRKVFSNILKYVRMGASSNFGNMFSVLGASAILPFLPMAPIQILTNNLLYDFSQVPIPTDDVDPEQIARPRPWSMHDLTRFILFIGPCSSVFDYTTYFMMLYLFGCWDPARAAVFQTGWFVESLLTQTLVIHVIRTNNVPFLQSRASVPLMATTAAILRRGRRRGGRARARRRRDGRLPGEGPVLRRPLGADRGPVRAPLDDRDARRGRVGGGDATAGGGVGGVRRRRAKPIGRTQPRPCCTRAFLQDRDARPGGHRDGMTVAAAPARW
jgi:Cation transporting ATPase, C-terminus